MHARHVTILVFLLTLWGAPPCCDGRIIKMEAKKRWTFVDKFVFDVRDDRNLITAPMVEFWAKDAKKPGYRLVLYSDQDYSWPAARGIIEDSDLWSADEISTCDSLTFCPDIGNCSTCMMRMCPSGIDFQTTCDGAGHCSGTEHHPYYQLINQHARPRFWYAGVTNCGPTDTPLTPIHVGFHFKNPGGWFREEFSVDEQGILELQLILVPAFAIMAGSYAGMTYRELRRQGDGAEVHAVVKWFLILIGLQVLYSIDKLNAYILVATYGEGHQYFIFAGFLASVMFMMLVVNFATGFCAIGVHFFTPLKDTTHQKIIGGLGLFLVVWNCVLFIWTRVFEDPLYVQSVYHTWPSILLAAARGPIIAYFVYCLYNTVREVPEQKSYYKKYGGCFLIYLCALPLFTIMAAAVSPHVRFRAVDITVDITTVVSMTFMAHILWPGPGLTNVLSNTYTLSSSGPTHMPMSDGPVPDIRSRRNSVNADVLAAPPPPLDDTVNAGGEEVCDDGGNPLRPLVAS